MSVRYCACLLFMLGAFLTVGCTPLQAQQAPQHLAVVVGVDHYTHGYELLTCAGRDATKIANGLDERLHYDVITLRAASGTVGMVEKADVEKALRDVTGSAKEGDTLLFYFSGHGSLRDGKQYLLLSDTDPADFANTALSFDTIESILASCRATKRLFIIDACRTTAGKHRRDVQTGFENGKLDAKFQERLDAVVRSAPQGLQVQSATLWACSPGQAALEPEVAAGEVGDSFFASEVLSALDANTGAELTVSGLCDYIRAHLPEAVRDRQTPVFEGESGLALGRLPGVVSDPISVANGGGGSGGRRFTAATRPTDPRLGDIWVNPKDGAEMIFIPAGPFLMGGDDRADNPRHIVTLSGYWICKNVVTVRQYKQFCQETGRRMPSAPSFNPNWSDEDHPIVLVSCEDAKAYGDWAGVRLPTEAQWEKAARGTDGRLFPWGDTWDTDKMWCSKNSGFDAGAGGTTAVGKYGISPYGLSDMAGNVWQWCSDWYDANFWKRRQSERVDPQNQGIGDQTNRILRGGSWRYGPSVGFRSAFRFKWPDGRYIGVGFRCACGL